MLSEYIMAFLLAYKKLTISHKGVIINIQMS